jgi:hypothetical protein
MRLQPARRRSNRRAQIHRTGRSNVRRFRAFRDSCCSVAAAGMGGGVDRSMSRAGFRLRHWSRSPLRPRSPLGVLSFGLAPASFRRWGLGRMVDRDIRRSPEAERRQGPAGSCVALSARPG